MSYQTLNFDPHLNQMLCKINRGLNLVRYLGAKQKLKTVLLEMNKLDLLEAEADIRLAVNSGFEPETFLRESGGAWTDRVQFLINEHKGYAQLKQEEVSLLEKMREDREEKKESQRQNSADDLMDMTEKEYLSAETEFAGIKMTGKEWRDFAKRNREHREESDAYAKRMGATDQGIEKSNAAIDALAVAPADRTDAQKAAIRDAQQDPEAREATEHKKDFFDEMKISSDNKISAENRAENSFDNEKLIEVNVSAKSDFAASASPTPSPAAEVVIQQKLPAPAYNAGGMDFG